MNNPDNTTNGNTGNGNGDGDGNGYACSLVLAAHGSLATEQANQSFYTMADELRQCGIFSDVWPALLHGDPQITGVLSLLPPGDVVVVPVMTSEGYYSQQVLPKALNENHDVDRYRLLIAPAVGVHPEIPDLVAARIRAVANACGINRPGTTVLIVGHGTTRNPNSGRATIDLVEKTKQRIAADPSVPCPVTIRSAFIDQPPLIGEVAEQIDGDVIIIPFLISCGPHATEDVPQAFGFPENPTPEFPLVMQRRNGVCICDAPVGLYPEIGSLCLELATNRLAGLMTVDIEPQQARRHAS